MVEKSFPRIIQSIFYLRIPPNLAGNWSDLLENGFDDLGGIGFDQDIVNPEYRWPSIDAMKKKLRENGHLLKKSLPIYPEFIEKGWYSEPGHQQAKPSET